MTDLQMSLIGIAGVFVAGVFTYNKIQEYKAKKSVERAFATDHDDVLMRTGEAPAPAAARPEPRLEPRVDPVGGPRQEPSFSLDGDTPAPGVAAGSEAAVAASLGAVGGDFSTDPIDPSSSTEAAEAALIARANAHRRPPPNRQRRWSTR